VRAKKKREIRLMRSLM
jgi:hypothetical protein